MNFKKSVRSILLVTLFSAISLGLPLLAHAQEAPLNLAQVLTALQSESSGMTLSQKNSFISQRVRERGVTFSVTSEIEAELRRAGASTDLISVVKANGPSTNQTKTTNSTNKTADVKFTDLWVEQNALENGREGLKIHAKFTVYNLINNDLQLTIRIQGADGNMLKTDNQNYRNKNGELALFKNLKPGYDAAVYEDWWVFVPYTEIPLSPGTHSVKIDADLIYPTGTLLKHMTLYPMTLVKKAPSLKAASASFEKIWVDYGVKEKGVLGMRIHVKMKTFNLKDTTCYLAVLFEKADGSRLVAGNTLFSDKNGNVTLFSELKPGYPTAVYSDISVFMPYDELNLPAGKYSLRMHADLVYPDGGLITHLTYNNFTYTKK